MENTGFVDIYQRDVNRRIDDSKKSRPRGASAIVNTAVEGVINENLAHAYKKAKGDIAYLKDKGERDRVGMRRQQYMEEYFLPAIEIVVNSTSPDEVLNSKRALGELDKYALLEGSGKGYTASYIRQAYGDQLGQVEGHSEALVRSEVQRLNALLDAGQIRTAVGIANKLKRQIDDGERLASEEDYDLIGRVVAFWD